MLIPDVIDLTDMFQMLMYCAVGESDQMIDSGVLDLHKSTSLMRAVTP